MKNFVSALTVIMLSMHLSAQTLEKPALVQASFGRYGSDCSSGRGTCSFSVSKNGLKTIPGKNTKRLSENSFLLQVDRNILTKSDEVSIAGTVFNEMNPGETVFFIQQDDIALDAITVQNLQIDEKYSKIAAGSYPMSISKNTVEIIFTLKDPNDVKH